MGKLCFFIEERVRNQYCVELEKKEAYEYIYNNKKLTEEQFDEWILNNKAKLFSEIFTKEVYYNTFKISDYTD